MSGRPLAQRLQELFTELSAVVARHQPDVVAVEGVFTHKNARSALVLGHARGVALLVAAQAGLPVHEYAPARVKRAVGAGGAGSKDAVAKMVCPLLQLAPDGSRADAFDALAVALCHLGQQRVPSRLSGPARLPDSFAARLKSGYRPPQAARRAGLPIPAESAP